MLKFNTMIKIFSLILLVTFWMGCKNESYPTIHRIVYGLPDTISACSCFVRDTLHYGYNDTTKRVEYFTDSIYYKRCSNGHEEEAGETLYFDEAIQDDHTPPNYTEDSFKHACDAVMADMHKRGFADSNIIFVGGGLGDVGGHKNASATSARWTKAIKEAMDKQDSIKHHK
jgi:hypothetical protein